MTTKLIKLFAIIYLCTLVTCFVARHGQSHGHKARIVGGKRALETQFPYVVAIIITEKGEEYPFRCTGSLITLSWVITAAHCYRDVDTDQNKGSRIIAGSVVSNRHTKSTQVRYSKRYIVHDKAGDRVTFDMDVALVQVTDPFEVSDSVETITIAKSPFPSQMGVNCYSMGFGKTDDEDKDKNAVLNFIEVIAGDYKYCNLLQSSMNAREESVCIRPVVEDTFTCSGDSGGPLVCQRLLAATLAGTAGVAVINGTIICTDPQGVTVEMFTGYFESWIRKYIPDLPNSMMLKANVPLPPPPPRPPQDPDDDIDSDEGKRPANRGLEPSGQQRNAIDSTPETPKITSKTPKKPETTKSCGSQIDLNFVGIVMLSMTCL